MHPLIPKLMREAREKKRLKQSEVAEKMNVKGATISSWELGKSEPNIDELVLYCTICAADFKEILTEAYGDTTAPMKKMDVTEDEAEMIRKFRELDERGKRNVRRTLNAEYEDATANFGEESKNVT